jgi:hypothetical protein
MHVVAPLDKQFPFLYAILKDHMADDPDYKVHITVKPVSVSTFFRACYLIYHCHAVYVIAHGLCRLLFFVLLLE